MKSVPLDHQNNPKFTGQASSLQHYPIHAPTIIIAAGAWANSLFEPLGIDLGLIPLLTRVTIFRWAFDRSRNI